LKRVPELNGQPTGKKSLRRSGRVTKTSKILAISLMERFLSLAIKTTNSVLRNVTKSLLKKQRKLPKKAVANLQVTLSPTSKERKRDPEREAKTPKTPGRRSPSQPLLLLKVTTHSNLARSTTRPKNPIEVNVTLLEQRLLAIVVRSLLKSSRSPEFRSSIN
jgi:hypothetical protein